MPALSAKRVKGRDKTMDDLIRARNRAMNHARAMARKGYLGMDWAWRRQAYNYWPVTKYQDNVLQRLILPEEGLIQAKATEV